MNKKNVLFSIALFIGVYGNSQTLPSQCKVFKPRVLHQTTIFQKDVKALGSGNNYGQTAGTTSTYWDVYSDRCDNVTYKAANKSSGEYTKLKFNQKVRIADIQNGFALVYTENKPGGDGGQYPRISGDVKCLGWIPMDNLLLWSSCPTNEYGIYRKALIVRNLDQNRDESFGFISEHPDVNNKTSRSRLKHSIDFHYIMKEIGSGDNTRYLIAKYNTLDGHTDRVIEGWVSRNSFSAWNQRSCLEPNWNADDVDFFMSKGEKAMLYADPNLTEETQPWTYGRKNSEGQEATQYRMPPAAMRFPILDNDSPKEKVFKMTAFGAPNGELGQQAVDMDKGKTEKEEALEAAAQVNVIIVIDGTRSMGKYFHAMSTAVQQATQYLEGQVKVGVVIYRDYADGANVIEYHKMASPNDASLQSFLKNIGRNGYGANSSKNDHTAHEALFLGLKTALNYSEMGYSPKNSNLVFIVGDCGNDPNDKKVSEAELLELCKKSMVQLFSFQVLNQDKLPWDDFNTQLTSLFKKHMDYLYSLKSSVKVTWRPTSNGLYAKPNTQEHYYMSEMHRGQVGVELSEGELTALIQKCYKTFRTTVEEQKEAIANFDGVIDIESDGTGAMGTSIRNEFLRRKLGSDYEAIRKANSLLAYTGYTHQDDGLGHDYWQAVVFLSTEELNALISRLTPLKIAAKANTYSTVDRKNYVDAVAGIIQSMTEKSADEIIQMTTEEITRIIAGLNVATPMLKGNQSEKVYTLSDIKNTKACPDEEFKKILHIMDRKIEALEKLPGNSAFKYSFTQNGKKSYWVPLSMIP